MLGRYRLVEAAAARRAAVLFRSDSVEPLCVGVRIADGGVRSVGHKAGQRLPKYGVEFGFKFDRVGPARFGKEGKADVRAADGWVDNGDGRWRIFDYDRDAIGVLRATVIRCDRGDRVSSGGDIIGRSAVRTRGVNAQGCCASKKFDLAHRAVAVRRRGPNGKRGWRGEGGVI